MGEENGRSAVTVAFVVVESDEREEQGEVKLRLKSGDIVKKFDEGGKVSFRFLSTSTRRGRPFRD